MEPVETRTIQCSHDGCNEFITVASATLDSTYTCAKHIPTKPAKASPAKNVPAEIKSWAKESSSSQPNTAPILSISEEQPEEMETSGGTKTIGANADIDDAAEEIGNDRNKRHDAPVTVPVDRPKQPAYLKSVAQPGVYNPANKEAPYGYDDLDRPIGVPVGRPYAKPEVKAIQEQPSGDLPCGGCGNDLCRHCHPEKAVKTDVLRSLTERPQTSADDSPNPDTTDLEENLRRQLGVPKPQSFRFVTSPKKKPFDYYPEILDITRKQLLDLFDRVVDTEVETVRLVETRLKSTTLIRQSIATLTRTTEHATKRLQCLLLLIEHSEKRILSWSARVMKRGSLSLGIPARAPENILDEKTREKLKYEEKKKLKKFQHWKTRLQEIVRKSRAQIEQLQERLDNWGSHPSDLENVTITRGRDITFREKFREPEEPINDLSESYAKLRELGATKTEAYISLLSTDYQLLAELSRSHPSLRPWRWFENEIVLQAIGFGLIEPTAKALEQYPRLKKYLDTNAWSEDDTEIDDSELRRSILKTGGAEIGASIYNFGRTRKGEFSLSGTAARRSGSFDGAIEFGKNGTSDDPSGGWAKEIDSGDYAEDIASQ